MTARVIARLVPNGFRPVTLTDDTGAVYNMAPLSES